METAVAVAAEDWAAPSAPVVDFAAAVAAVAVAEPAAGWDWAAEDSSLGALSAAVGSAAVAAWAVAALVAAGCQLFVTIIFCTG